MLNSSSLSERVGNGVATINLLRTLPIWNGQADQIVCSDIGYFPLDHLWGDLALPMSPKRDGRKSGYIRLINDHPTIERLTDFDVIGHSEITPIDFTGKPMIDAIAVWCESVCDIDEGGPQYQVPSFPFLERVLSARHLLGSISSLMKEGFSRFIFAGGYFYDMNGIPCVACFHPKCRTNMYIPLENARFQKGDCFIAVVEKH